MKLHKKQCAIAYRVLQHYALIAAKADRRKASRTLTLACDFLRDEETRAILARSPLLRTKI